MVNKKDIFYFSVALGGLKVWPFHDIDSRNLTQNPIFTKLKGGEGKTTTEVWRLFIHNSFQLSVLLRQWKMHVYLWL